MESTLVRSFETIVCRNREMQNYLDEYREKYEYNFKSEVSVIVCVFFLRACVCVHVRVYVCVCVCMCVLRDVLIQNHITFGRFTFFPESYLSLNEI